MYISMLEAISEMLADSKEIKVQCAKTMLDKIIEGMKDEPKLTITNTFTDAKPPTPPENPKPLSEKRKAKADEVEITVDAGIIQSIKNAKDDTMIELDGKAVPWRTAIGQSFSKGKVL